MGVLGLQERALLTKLREGGFRPAHQIPIAESRAGLTAMAIAMAAPKAPVRSIEECDIRGPGGKLRVRIYRPEPTKAASDRVVLFFHGGGFYLGNLETHDHVCRALCKNAGVTVVAVDYRLAPEHKFPAAVEDCYAALRWAANNAVARGWNAGRIALVGDSAGGTLVAAVCLLARQRRGPVIAFQVMVYPALTVEDGLDFPSRVELGNGDYFISFADFKFFRDLYLEDVDRDAANPLASPIRAKDFRGLPPALVVAAEFDPCRDENLCYAELLKAAGVAVEYVCFEGTIHPFYLFDGVLDAGRKGQELVADRVHRALTGAIDDNGRSSVLTRG
jgi:acetyl esterase